MQNMTLNVMERKEILGFVTFYSANPWIDINKL